MPNDGFAGYCCYAAYTAGANNTGNAVGVFFAGSPRRQRTARRTMVQSRHHSGIDGL
jgi:hypothetical protein